MTFTDTTRICLVLFAALLFSGCAEQTPPMQADTLYVGEHVLTMDDALTDVTAVAVQGENIVWVGSREQWQGEAKRTVELNERALLPGFIDAHGHMPGLAQTLDLSNVASPPVGTVVSISSMQNVLREYMAERAIAPGDWVVGRGYDDSLLEEQRHPDRNDLDAVSTEHPIALVHVSGHLMAANSLALELAGITTETPDPPGGLIRRRSDGAPDGVLEETAAYPVRAVLQGFNSDPAGNLARALQLYASNGITTAQDGASSWDTYDQLNAADLTLDVVIYPVGMDPDFAVRPDVSLRTYDERLKVNGIKMFLDGSPQGKTAYLTEPYHVVPLGADEDYRGYPTIPQETVDSLVARYIAQDIPMLVHCNGDAAAQMLIDALERAAEKQPLGDHRTVMIHAQTVREDQLDRMQALGVVPSFFSAHTFYWGDWHRDSVLGVERGSRISPTRTTLQRGMPFTVHNDSPVVPPDMIRLLWATTNRVTRSGQVLGIEQRIPVLEAIRAVTVHAAYQHFEEESKGSITPGKQADLVILNENPVNVPIEELMRLEVVETISRGQAVFIRD